jgi:myosin heavy subunit
MAAVLHLGNVQLETNKEGKAAVKAMDTLKIVAELLQVSVLELQSSIILKKMRAGTTEMLVPLDQDKAERLRGSHTLLTVQYRKY